MIDIFDRDDLGGGAKALWLLLVFVLPLFGTLIYLMTRPVTDKDRRRAEEVDPGVGPDPSGATHGGRVQRRRRARQAEASATRDR
ncbi:MAG: PLDc N-terminal domain-containing protein [Acidimicrobiales bacterium]